MFSSLTYLLLLAAVASADVFADVNDYLKPAKLDSKILADIGLKLVKNELADHEDKWEELVPVDSLMFKYIWQMARPAEMVSSSLCPECKDIVKSTQNFIINYPGTLIALPAACSLFQLKSQELVPICGVTSIGALLYLQNSQPKDVCELLCSSNSTISKREAGFNVGDIMQHFGKVF